MVAKPLVVFGNKNYVHALVELDVQAMLAAAAQSESSDKQKQQQGLPLQISRSQNERLHQINTAYRQGRFKEALLRRASLARDLAATNGSLVVFANPAKPVRLFLPEQLVQQNDWLKPYMASLQASSRQALLQPKKPLLLTNRRGDITVFAPAKGRKSFWLASLARMACNKTNAIIKRLIALLPPTPQHTVIEPDANNIT